MAFVYSSAQVPVPLVPTAPPAQGGCTDTTTTAGALQGLVQASGLAFNPLRSNQALAAMAAAFAFPGFGGVMSGVTLSTVASLALPVAAGVVNIAGPVVIAAQSVVVPDNTTLAFIWALQNGTCTYTLTTTPPAANCAYIGNFTSLSGAVVAVDYTMVPYCTASGLICYCNDRSAPVNAPNTGTFFQVATQGGLTGPHFIWNGSNYFGTLPSLTPLSFNLTLTGTLQLLPQDNNFKANLVASGGNQIVLLPDPATIPDQWMISIYNVGSSNSLVVKDHTGVTTLATVTTTNKTLGVAAAWNGTSVVFPTGPYSPGPIPTPGAISL